MQENIKQVIVKNTVRKEFKTAPIWQWDTGHILVFEGFDLPEAFQVHFAFSESGEAVTQIGSNDQVTVPDALVEDGRMIYAWLYISTEDAGLTKFVILMPVNRRAKPTHQVPPPVEHSEIEQAIVVLNAAVEKTETAAENAEQSEENASQYAENAYNSSVAAANAAESAEGDARTATQKAQEAITAALDADRKAQNASESAQLASQKASEASGYADGLAEAVRTANEAKQTAVNKATEATQSASNAAQKAQEALSSAQAAEGSANDADTAKRGAETAKDGAQGYAGNASISAQAAETAKNTAVEKAGEASQSATNAAQSATAASETAAQFEKDITQLKSDIESKPDIDDTAGEGDTDKTWSADKLVSELQDKADVIINTASGAIASFPDGAAAPVEKLVVSVEPVQDLHGYDHPWPAGSGKNKFNPEEAQNNKWIADGGVIQDVTGYWITGFIPVKSGDTVRCPSKGSARNAWYSADKSQSTNFAYSGTDDTTGVVAPYDGFVVITAHGGTVAFVGEFIVTINDTDLTYTPYSNICPITGWDGVKVTRTGKNLMPMTAYQNFSYNAKIGRKFVPKPANHNYVDNGNGSFTISGLGSWEQCCLIVPAPAAGKYYLSLKIDGGPTISINKLNREYVAVSNSTYLANPLPASETVTRMETITEPGYILVYIGAHNAEITITNPSCQYEEPITDYEPYAGNTYDITLPTEAGTVYGGELTVNADGSGSLVVDRKSVVYDGSNDEAWNGLANLPWRYTITAGDIKLGNAVSFYVTSNLMRTTAAHWDKANYGILNNMNSIIVGYPPASNDVAAFRAFLSSNPLQVVYLLATPVTYTLTPTKIRTLLGTNNIWADTGDVSVKYNADTKLYIDGKIAELVAQIVNS